VRQPVLPADAIPIGPAAGLVDGADGGAVFVFGQATFAFATDDEVGSPAGRGAAGRHRNRLGVGGRGRVRDRAGHPAAVGGRLRRQVRPDARLLDEERKLQHVRLDPATAPRRSRALHALCQQLTETGTRYPDTNLTISYGVKGQPDTP